jgi:hypothetical protein
MSRKRSSEAGSNAFQRTSRRRVSNPAATLAYGWGIAVVCLGVALALWLVVEFAGAFGFWRTGRER